MDLIRQLVHTLFPLTQAKLVEFISYVGPGKFCIILFAIIFCETGLVALPFLPGDSLLFTVGAIVASPDSPFGFAQMAGLLIAAALLGDNCNYWLGRRLGPKVFSKEKSRLFSKKHLEHTQKFYEKYGTKTIILARFVPIARTFAPFVAGIGKMPYGRFLLFSVVGGVAWVSICLSAGYAFGNIPFVQKRFEVVVIAIVVISVLPLAIEFIKARRAAKIAPEAKDRGFEPVTPAKGSEQ